jgi:hypothetical protein
MILNGTTYDDQTPQAVAEALEHARIGEYRIRIHYGHTGDVDCTGKPCERGRDWLEESGTEGYVGRSTGTNKIPLMIHNSRCLGGSALLDHCILRITRAFSPLIHTQNRSGIGRGRVVLYESPDWKRPNLRHYLEGRYADSPWRVDRDGEDQARFRTEAGAHRYIRRFTH